MPRTKRVIPLEEKIRKAKEKVTSTVTVQSRRERCKKWLPKIQKEI